MVDLRRSILQEIQKDRENEIVDKDLIKESISQFIYMGYEKKTIIRKLPQGDFCWFGEKNLLLYDQDFESHLKTATKEFYEQKSEKWCNQLSCNEYIMKVSQHIKKEEDNSDYFLQPETKTKILDITLREAVENKAEQLTLKDTGCKYMFDEKKIEQLTSMYRVFNRVEQTLKFIINQMNPYIMSEGGKIVTNPQNQAEPLKFTDLLLNFKA